MWWWTKASRCANGRIHLVASNESDASAESWTVWPTHEIGTDYIVLDAAEIGGEFGMTRQISVIGTHPATAVSIRNSMGSIRASFVLNRGQAFRYIDETPIVGWRVTADKPIAVLAGVECARDLALGCNMTAEQLPPLKHWSRRYVVAPGFAHTTTTATAIHVVVAAENATTVEVTDSTGFRMDIYLDENESWPFGPLGGPGPRPQLGYFIYADKPIGVVSNVMDPGDRFDPTMVVWPPVQAYVSEAKMPTLAISDNVTQHFLTIITDTAATSSIRLNGAVTLIPSSNWKAIPFSGYSYIRAVVPKGTNLVQGLGGAEFAAIAFGGAYAIEPVQSSYSYSSQWDIGHVVGASMDYHGDVSHTVELPSLHALSATPATLTTSNATIPLTDLSRYR